mgnify:CR=1 FL=1
MLNRLHGQPESYDKKFVAHRLAPRASASDGPLWRRERLTHIDAGQSTGLAAPWVPALMAWSGKPIPPTAVSP